MRSRSTRDSNSRTGYSDGSPRIVVRWRAQPVLGKKPAPPTRKPVHGVRFENPQLPSNTERRGGKGVHSVLVVGRSRIFDMAKTELTGTTVEENSRLRTPGSGLR